MAFYADLGIVCKSKQSWGVCWCFLIKGGFRVLWRLASQPTSAFVQSLEHGKTEVWINTQGECGNSLSNTTCIPVSQLSAGFKV